MDVAFLFNISKRWTNSIHRAWKVSDIIGVLQIIRDLEKPRNSIQDKTNRVSRNTGNDMRNDRKRSEIK